MAISNDDVVRTTVNFTLQNGVQYQNVYHHILDGIGGISDANVVTDIETWVEAIYDELVSIAHGSIVEQLCSVDQVNWNGTEWVITANLGTFTPAWAPVGGVDSNPNQIAAFVTFKTARPTTVGRKFLFPPPDASQDDGILAAPAIAALVAYAALVMVDIDLDVVNALKVGVPRTGVFEWYDFTSAIVTDLLGTQRRRRPGYGA